MLVSTKHNYVFLCTPKCASTSIEAALKPYSNIVFGQPFKHTNYRDYSRYFDSYICEKSELDCIETICIVREPLSWLHSWYQFRSRNELRNPEHPKHKNSTFGTKFEEFVKAYMSPNPPSFANVGSQFSFVKDEKNKVGVDTIFMYENISDFVEYMSNKVGKRLKIEYKNMSPLNDYKPDPALIVGRIKQKIAKKLNLSISIRATKDIEISEYLMSELQVFMSADYELYERLKKA